MDVRQLFSYADAVVERYPAIHAGIVHATKLANGPSPPSLIDIYRSEQRAVAARWDATPIADIPSIRAWRRAFTSFGAKPTQHRNAAEALLRRLAKQGDVPTINALVDIGNLVSIRYALPVAIFDLAGIAGSITVRFAEGTEPFADLGSAGTVVVPTRARWSSSTRTGWCAPDSQVTTRSLPAPSSAFADGRSST